MQDDAAFLDAFHRAEIHPRDFDHRAHIRMAFLHLRDQPFDQAAARVRAGLTNFLAAAQEKGVELPVGYHETVTIFWLRMVQSAMKADPSSALGDSSAFCNAHPHLLRRRLLLDYYSRDRAMTDRARAEFVPPDLKPMPQTPAEP